MGGETVATSSTAVTYVDGVYGGIGGNYDIGRVEVLRGPQGTLYGRSATSGLVAIYTRNPDLGNFGGDVTAEFGNYSLRYYTAAVNAPIVSDQLAVRVSGGSGPAAHHSLAGYDMSKSVTVEGAIKSFQWTVVDENCKLQFLFTIDDPKMYREPFTLLRRARWRPDENVPESNCEAAQLDPRLISAKP